MDGTWAYHPEWGNQITKYHTWCVLTDKWILAEKFRISKIHSQTILTSRRKFKVWMLLRRGNWILTGGIMGQNVEQSQKERPSRDCPTWRSIPYAVAKPRHYCRCWEPLADQRLIWLAPEGLFQNLENTETNVHSQILAWVWCPYRGSRDAT